MTIVGSKRMIVYDDVAPLEKIRIFDIRVSNVRRITTRLANFNTPTIMATSMRPTSNRKSR
jgi:hypothetical protein